MNGFLNNFLTKKGHYNSAMCPPSPTRTLFLFLPPSMWLSYSLSLSFSFLSLCSPCTFLALPNLTTSHNQWWTRASQLKWSGSKTPAVEAMPSYKVAYAPPNSSCHHYLSTTISRQSTSFLATLGTIVLHLMLGS